MDRDESYRELFELSPDAILMLEGDRFVDCNPAAVRMLRFPNKQALLECYSGKGSPEGRSAHPGDISPPTQPDGRDSFEKAEEYIAIAFERGSHTFEWMHLCADGEPILVEVQLTVVRRGERPLLHVVWRDISERKRLEAELRRSHRLEAVGRLAGGIAHDFNNLLVVMLSCAELLEKRFESNDPGLDLVVQIREAADRAADLTRQLLAFSRGQPAQSRPLDLRDLIGQLGSLLRRLIGEHIDLLIDPGRESEPMAVEADPSQLEQIVVNLVANARDAMPQGGRVRISVDRRQIRPWESTGQVTPGDYVALSVADSGQGMNAEQLDRAFDPFYTTKSLGKGTGLGLATVYAIAEQNGGHASIASAPGKGTTVEVLLPHSADRTSWSTLFADQAAAHVVRSGGGESILLVEDETTIRDLFETSLKMAGYRVTTAGDGQEALDRVSREDLRVDLLVTDVVMPRMSGPDLVRRLLPLRPHLRVLYMSGYSADANLSVMPRDERAVVLQKPFSPKLLLAEIRKALNRGPA